MASSLRQVALMCSGHTRPVVDLAFAQKDNGDVLLISACKDGRPMLRDGVTGDWIGTFEGHKGAVWSVCLDGGGKLAATGSADFTAKLWDTTEGIERLSLGHKHIVRAVDLSPDGNFLMTGSADKKIRHFDVSNATAKSNDVAAIDPLRTLEGHTSAVKYVRLLGDGKRLLSVGDDRTIRVWDPSAGEGGGLIKTIELPSLSHSLELTPSSNGGGQPQPQQFLITLANKVQLWSTDSFEMLKELTLPCPMYAASLHREGRFVACGGDDFRLYKMDLETGAELESFRGHFGPVHCCAFSPDGQLYASGSEDGTVRLWQTVVGTTYGLWKYVEGSNSASASVPVAENDPPTPTPAPGLSSGDSPAVVPNEMNNEADQETTTTSTQSKDDQKVPNEQENATNSVTENENTVDEDANKS